jgi:hypothetical protein
LTTVPTEADPARRAVWRYIHDGVMLGLPVPLTVNIYQHCGLDVRCPDNRPDDVDRWAEFLGCPRPAYDPKPFTSNGRTWRSYLAARDDWPLTSYAKIWSAVDDDSLSTSDEPS